MCIFYQINKQYQTYIFVALFKFINKHLSNNINPTQYKSHLHYQSISITIDFISSIKNKQQQFRKQMFRQLLKLAFFRMSAQLENIYSLKYQVKDVTKLRGLNSDNPYVTIENKRIQIAYNKIIAHVMAQSPFNIPNQLPNIRFLDVELNVYNPASPTLALLQNSFYIKLNNHQLYFVANKQSIIKTSYNAEFIATDAPKSLEIVATETIKSLNEVPQYITPSNLNTMLIKNVLQQTLAYKKQKIRIKQMFKIVQNKIQQFDAQIQAINQLVYKKARYRTRIFSSLMIGQYAIVHYLIYFHLSWDIMEPITVILANLDILLGYYFFVFKGKQYSLEEIQKNIAQKNKFNYLKKYKFNLQKYEQLLQLRGIFQARLDLQTKNPYILMDLAQKPIKLLDTR